MIEIFFVKTKALDVPDMPINANGWRFADLEMQIRGALIECKF
jgi:hypothetical protein